MIVPDVVVWLTLPEVTYGSLPVIDIIDAVAVSGTSARETHEARLQVGDSLCKVLAKAVGASLICILWEERNEVELQFSHL